MQKSYVIRIMEPMLSLTQFLPEPDFLFGSTAFSEELVVCVVGSGFNPSKQNSLDFKIKWLFA